MMDDLDEMSLSVTCFGTLKIFWPATAGCRALWSFEVLIKTADPRVLPPVFVFLLTHLFGIFESFAFGTLIFLVLIFAPWFPREF